MGCLLAQRPVQLCHMPSSNTARFADFRIPLAVAMTAVGGTLCGLSGTYCWPASIWRRQAMAGRAHHGRPGWGREHVDRARGEPAFALGGEPQRRGGNACRRCDDRLVTDGLGRAFA